LHYLRRYHAAPGQSDRELLERFTRQGDESAFVELLRRHGPMVLGVCRRMLGDAHEAEDAFQTTFLLLVRKAAGLRQPDGLGPWLHGVAYRTSLKARSLRRRLITQPQVEDRPAPVSDELLWRDLRPVLDAAIASLPGKYRVPFVLCYLEGRTNAEAAVQLGCPPATVATRLARARAWLRGRLTRRGMTLPAGFLTLGLAAQTARAVPPALVEAIRSTRAAGSVAGPVAILLKGVSKTMWMEKIRLWLVSTVVLGGVSVGVGAWTYRSAAGENDPPPRVPAGPFPAPPLAIQPPAQDPKPPRHQATVRTANFIVTADSRVARLIADEAERQRKKQAHLWLGKELPAWPQLCPVQVDIAASGTGGATAITFNEGQVSGHTMRLEGPLDRLLTSALPHEVTHLVLAHHFKKALPRWADEGTAILAEDEDDQRKHEGLAERILTTPGRAIPLRRLFALKDYPPDVMTLFAQGFSVTRFLVQQKDRARFLRFLEQGMADGWDKAAQAHYGYEDVEKLEDAWLARFKDKKRPMAVDFGYSSGPPKDHGSKDVQPPEHNLPKGPAPTAALARMGDNSWIAVMQGGGVFYYEPVTRYVRRGDQVTEVTSYEFKQTEEVLRVPFDKVQAFTGAGKRVSAEKLRQRLRQLTPVLVSTKGEPVDPFHLQFLKEDTLILVLTTSQPPAAPAAVAPAKPPLSVPQPPTEKTPPT
jgi:RNA polymerase sigma factor (sigma-70 family)